MQHEDTRLQGSRFLKPLHNEISTLFRLDKPTYRQQRFFDYTSSKAPDVCTRTVDAVRG